MLAAAVLLGPVAAVAAPFSSLGGVTPGSNTPVLEDTRVVPGEVIELAHHGGEAGGAGAAGVALGGSSVLAVNAPGGVGPATDSLWGNLLLSMAYQRDPVVRKYAKRLGRVNTFTLLSIVGISGLGLAQSISALDNVHGSQTYHVMSHDGGPEHIHTEAESKTPATLGIIGSSATLATLGAKAMLDGVYGSKLKRRQAAIQRQVEGILTRLRGGEPVSGVSAELATLVGPTAAEEFATLWRQVYERRP